MIKTHEPYRNSYRRAIYLVRDVRDVALSFYKLRAVEGFEEDFEAFLVRFAQGKIGGFRSWQGHVESWLAAADSSGVDVFIVRYEELIDAPLRKLEALADFLDVSIGYDDLEAIIKNNTTDKMRRRDTNYSEARMNVVVGRGTYGGWQSSYSSAQLARLGAAAPAMRRLGYDFDVPDR